MRLKLRPLSIAAALVALAASSEASASTGLEFPDVGVNQLGRGSAWIARADDPLATFFNPAALVRQPTSVHLGAHLVMPHRCFTRLGPDGQPVSPGANLPGPGATTDDGSIAPPAETCENFNVGVLPQLAVNFRILDRFALGLALVTPHGTGSKHEWPETVPYTNRFGIKSEQPAPNRFMLVSSSSTILMPTLSASVGITDELSFGAGFIWGVAIAEFQNLTEAVSPSSPNPSDDYVNHLEVKAKLNATDAFIPGFVLGALWSPGPFDVAAWFKWMDAIDTTADARLESLYWDATGRKNQTPCAPENPGCNVTEEELRGRGRLRLNIPLELKLGVRYHHARQNPGKKPSWATNTKKKVRDPMSEDLFDIELNINYANNSSVRDIQICFEPTDGAKAAGVTSCSFNASGVPVRGAEPGQVPVNASVPHNWKDTVSFRLGGELVPIASVLALRAGAWFETPGQDDADLNVDFHNGWRLGASGGATVRLGPVDISAAYQHTFFGTLDNGGRGNLRGLSGDATAGFRTRQAINGGRLNSHVNEVALGGTLRF